MLSILYNLLIMPIQIIVEMTYSLMSRFLKNKGLAIIAVSLVIQTLILPLYKRSDALQEEERLKQEKMSKWVNHIKKTFKGDERFMMLQTYYRQQDYKTVYALRSSFSILLQIPFFLAAYNYLSNLQELRGVSFLFIKDLGSPDKLFTIAGFGINILPILMTLFNIISGIIYTKGLPLKSKLQVYILAAVFLVLLYNSPSGLVLYWTMNNLYSLLKNVFMKILKHPNEVLGVIGLVSGIGMIVYVSKFIVMSKLKALFIIVFMIACQIPWITERRSRKKEESEEKSSKLDKIIVDKSLHTWEGIFFTVLLGALIPISVICSSASEFVSNGVDPMSLIYRNISMYAGIFIVWFSIFYYLMKDGSRKIFSIAMFAIAGMLLFNYLKYSGNMGVMNAAFEYEVEPSFAAKQIIINLLIIVALMAVMLLVVCWKSKLAKSALQVLIICMIILCIKNTVSIKDQIRERDKNNANMAHADIFTLSKTGNNVVVIMLDRAIGGYVPYIMEERPDLKEQFAGFTYYSNTLSFGPFTNFTTPSLFGGYEYTPTEMNKRDSEKLVDKHNEALTVMPAIFSENGYNVTVCDPPYAGYTWDPDLSIYDGYENVNAYVTKGAFSDKLNEITDNNFQKHQQDNMVYFCMMQTMPLALKGQFYNHGIYFGCLDENEYSFPEEFVGWYTALLSLSDMTKIEDEASNNFLMLQNSTTHEPILFNTPEYLPTNSLDVDAKLAEQTTRVVDGNTMYLSYIDGLSHYETDVASLQCIGQWLDYLRENGVYDNTRIIIVADHGRELAQFEYMKLENGVDVQYYNPLLLIKDFNSTEFTVSDEFMTNADVPTYATADVIENPVNPFTGNVINNDEKFNHPQVITTSHKYSTKTNNGYTFDTSDAPWYEVSGDIFDVNNWKLIGY